MISNVLTSTPDTDLKEHEASSDPCGHRIHDGALSPAQITRRNARSKNQSKNGDVRLLSAILFIHGGRATPKSLAERLLAAYGSLPKVLCAPDKELLKIQGAQEDDIIAIKSAYATILETVFTTAAEAQSLDYQALVNYALFAIGQCSVEKVLLLYLDQRNRLIGTEILCSGSRSSVSVTVRQVVLAVCNRDASSFIIAHNHPSGSVLPSEEDRALTKLLVQTAAMMGVILTDSIIVSGCNWFSFQEIGYTG